MTQEKKQLHFYTDCPFFGGSERMLARLISNQELSQIYDMCLHYRFSAEYQDTLSPHISDEVKVMPVRGLYCESLVRRVKNSVLRKLLLLGAQAIKYPACIYNVIRLYCHFRQYDIDILHINSGGYPAAYSSLAAVLAAKCCGIKSIIYFANNLAVSYKNPARWLDYPIDCLVKGCVTQFVTGSKFAGSCLAEVLSLSNRQYRSIHNTVAVQPTKPSKIASRELLQLPIKQLIFGVVALLEKRKGHIVLLKAYKLLREQSVDIPLLLIEGVGSEQATLMNYVKQHGLEDSVRFIGSTPHIFDFIQSLDVLILPSIAQEDFPNVILEAMALARPVVASALAGTPEQVDDGTTGFLVPPNSAVDLAKALVAVLNSAVRESLGLQARRKFEECFTLSVVIRHYKALYQYVLTRE